VLVIAALSISLQSFRGAMEAISEHVGLVNYARLLVKHLVDLAGPLNAWKDSRDSAEPYTNQASLHRYPSSIFVGELCIAK
jgi:hypothetical protein